MIVSWTEAALANLAAAEVFVSRQSPRYARELIERIFLRVEILATQPRIGPVVPEYGDEALRELLESPYRVVYRIEEDRIDIIAVLHGASRFPRGL